MARAFRGRAPSRGPRRESMWLSIPVASDTITSGSVLMSVLNAAALELRPFTVIRTHITLHVNSDQIAADELQICAFGLEVVSEAAAAAGVASIPTPFTELDSDFWFLHQIIMAEFTFASGVGFDADGGKTVTIDSKAMRKVNNDEQVAIVAQGDFTVGSGFAVTMAGRMLIKLH